MGAKLVRAFGLVPMRLYASERCRSRLVDVLATESPPEMHEVHGRFPTLRTKASDD